MSLESLRRNQAGTTGMAIFIALSANQRINIRPYVLFLEQWRDLGQALLDEIPNFLYPFKMPFVDYLTAVD
jgi:hypothetical protein